MKKLKALFCLVLALGMMLTLFGCAGNAPVAKSGEFVTNKLEGAEQTQYVFCVSKNDPDAEVLVAELNKVIADTDVAALTDKYMDYANRRGTNPIGDIHLFDNTGDFIYAYTCVLEPFNYSGAGGAYADGVDVWLLSMMAENLGRRLQLNDLWYQDAYDTAKTGKGVLATGMALTDQVKNDFLVSDVYATGYQQIISDKNQSFTKLEQLKGLKIGVLTGRTGETLVKQAIESGVLKGTGAEMVCFNTDAEAYVALKNEDFDVLVIDELPAKMLVTRGF